MLHCDSHWLALATAALLFAQFSVAKDARERSRYEVPSFKDYPEFIQEGLEKDRVDLSIKLRPRQQPGASCYQDAFLKDMQSVPDSTPYCSSFLGLQAATSTMTVYAGTV